MGPLAVAGNRERSPPHWLGRAPALGVSAVELDLRLAMLPSELARLLADHGLSLAGAACVGGLLDLTLADEQRRLAAVLERSLAAGNDLLVYTDFTRSIRDDEAIALAARPQLRRDDLRRYGEKLTRLADWLMGEGSVLAYLPRASTFLLGEAEIDLLMASTDTSVRLALDSGAVAIAEADFLDLVRRHAARLHHLRLQQADGEKLKQARGQGWSWPRLVREGALAAPSPEMADPDPAALGTVLAEVGYAGWIAAAAERDPDLPPPLEEAVAGALAALGVLRHPPQSNPL